MPHSDYTLLAASMEKQSRYILLPRTILMPDSHTPHGAVFAMGTRLQNVLDRMERLV
jgi:hypothetical protein